MGAVRRDFDLYGNAASRQGCKQLREHRFRRIPAQLRLEDFTHAGQGNRADQHHLHRDGGALGRARAHPVMQLGRRGPGTRFELHIGHG